MHQPHAKFAYFGTPYVARDTLALLLERGFVPSVVITNPDALKGRGMELAPSPTKALALEHALPVLTPETLDDAAVAEIKNYGCEYAIVVAYGKLFPQALIDSFPKGAINVHYSLLPKYRGASPVESALLNGDTITGVAIQQMAQAMDAGDLLALEAVAIGPAETAKELKPRLIKIGAELLVEMLPRFERGDIVPTPQDHALATRARKIKKGNGEINPAGDARENWNKYRAYAEWPGIYFFSAKDGPASGGKDGKRIKVTHASFVHGQFIIEKVVPEGKREMAYADFARSA